MRSSEFVQLAGKGSVDQRLAGIQLRQPRENGMDNTIAAGTHEWKRIFCVCPDTGKEPAACHRAATMQANLYVIFGEVERGGCLCGAQFFDVSHHDHDTVLFRKTKQCFFEKLAEFGCGSTLLGIRRSLDHIHRKFSVLLDVVQLRIAFAQAEAAQRFVDRNARQPR